MTICRSLQLNDASRGNKRCIFTITNIRQLYNYNANCKRVIPPTYKIIVDITEFRLLARWAYASSVTFNRTLRDITFYLSCYDYFLFALSGQLHPTLYNENVFFSMLGLKIIHGKKIGPQFHRKPLAYICALFTPIHLCYKQLRATYIKSTYWGRDKKLP